MRPSVLYQDPLAHIYTMLLTLTWPISMPMMMFMYIMTQYDSWMNMVYIWDGRQWVYMNSDKYKRYVLKREKKRRVLYREGYVAPPVLGNNTDKLPELGLKDKHNTKPRPITDHHVVSRPHISVSETCVNENVNKLDTFLNTMGFDPEPEPEPVNTQNRPNTSSYEGLYNY